MASFPFAFNNASETKRIAAVAPPPISNFPKGARRAKPGADMAAASYPALRLRRTRAAAWSRALVAETVLTPADLIWPLFVTEGEGAEEPIATLPGVSRWSVDRIGAQARI